MFTVDGLCCATAFKNYIRFKRSSFNLMCFKKIDREKKVFFLSGLFVLHQYEAPCNNLDKQGYLHIGIETSLMLFL